MDLSTRYMGLSLKNPIVPSACGPLSATLDGVKSLEDAGASAIVLYSLFEEQITHEEEALEHYLSYGSESYAEALDYFPNIENFLTGPEEYLEHIRKVKSAVSVPVIGSLNGVSQGGWIKYAKNIQDAGADALELNIYHIPTDPSVPGNEIEKRYLETLQAVKKTVTIPVAIKISPYFSSIAYMVKAFDQAGADAIVLFNRFYQPDLDLEHLDVVPHLVLSTPFEMRLPLRWVAILYGKIKANMAVTSGVQTFEDVLKVIMAGADVAMMCSELLKNGVLRISQILIEMQQWMEEREYSSLEQMKGSMSQIHVPNGNAFERANYMKTLQSYKQFS